MQFKGLLFAALAATASAQMNLTATLLNQTDLSNLTSYISLFPAIVSALSSATNITILAPSNEAFAAFMNSSAAAALKTNDTAAIQALLSYHILNGTYNTSAITKNASFIPTELTSNLFTNVTGGQVVEAIDIGSNTTFYSGLLANSSVVTANITFTGGVIHIINQFLTIPANISTTGVAAGLSAAVGAARKSGLADALDMMKDVTVFVPNNGAFEAIGSALSNISQSDLTKILEYHVVNGTVAYSSKLMNNTQIMALNGENLTISIVNGSYYVNSAKVLTADVLVSNGVVHIIDNVLNPAATSLTPNASTTAQPPAFSATPVSSQVPFTSGIATPTTTLGGGAGPAASSASSSAGAWAPLRTGAMGYAALFAAGAAGAGGWVGA